MYSLLSMLNACGQEIIFHFFIIIFGPVQVAAEKKFDAVAKHRAHTVFHYRISYFLSSLIYTEC